MRTNTAIETLLDNAQQARRCAAGANESQRKSLRLRAHQQLLVTPYRNMYARPEYWQSLSPPERHLHVARTLSELHSAWTFAGLTAVCAYGLEHSYALHRELTVHIASTTNVVNRKNALLRRIHVHNIQRYRTNGIPVTDIRRTLIDCASMYSFTDTLPMFDSAARKGVSLIGLPESCRALGIDSANVVALCTYADPLSENGGESFARATIIELGFIVPRLQRPFTNPTNPNAPLRADFTWELPGGIIIVGEFDGMEKYVMNDTTRNSVQARVHAERERENQLKAQGVTTIVRFEFEDLTHPERLERKLLQAGVPKRR
ncbi:hypothetical protein [Bifidobacterium tissieri]|uniref:CTP synthase n=1 Tax=Bifidobacterium tissieri TaxID=1630162 RepID=A0A5M9ZNT1_9BIFI|nr:hypothetical protein [Bifidobacterium tissieri]KAA8829291.1 hypothetical protein EMO89_08325 [Bifidobacterium tissieri]KAA8831895.1 hypothetical protein EM849_06540 [Bifidobacterium tissieri]